MRNDFNKRNVFGDFDSDRAFSVYNNWRDGNGTHYEEVFHKYRPLIGIVVNQYFNRNVPSMDVDDLISEAMIKLNKILAVDRPVLPSASIMSYVLHKSIYRNCLDVLKILQPKIFDFKYHCAYVPMVVESRPDQIVISKFEHKAIKDAVYAITFNRIKFVGDEWKLCVAILRKLFEGKEVSVTYILPSFKVTLKDAIRIQDYVTVIYRSAVYDTLKKFEVYNFVDRYDRFMSSITRDAIIGGGDV